MDDATSAPRTCEVCGDPISPWNSFGICGNSAKPGCRRARKREYLKRQRVEAAGGQSPPEPQVCKICGGPLRRDNSVGICATNPECTKANVLAHARIKGAKPQRRITIETGEVYGCWTALEDHRPRTGRNVLCRCACGAEKPVPAFRLVSGTSRSCGCPIGKAADQAAKLAAAEADPYVRAGQRFGLLVALEDGPFAKTVIAYRCDCGNVKRDAAGTLRRLLKSCGHTRSATLSASKTVHGLSKHPLFGTWYNMLSRCYNPTVPSYPRYGGRGVRVHESWRATPTGFIAWIEANLGPRPVGMTLDRWPDNDGNYEPGNLRWATCAQQTANRRTVAGVTSQRDAALAEVERLNEVLASMSRKRGKPAPDMTQDAPF